MKKSFTILISISLFLVCIVLFSSNNKSTLVTGDKELDKIYTKKEIQEDREQIISIVENVHPIFLQEVPKKYYDAKEKYIKETKKQMTLGEFQLATSRYTSVLDDGHTGIGFTHPKFLDINWKYINGDLVILDENNKPTTQTVTSINNIDVNHIFQIIEETFPFENYVDEYMNYTNFSKERLILTNAGVDTTENIILEINNNNKSSQLEVKFKDNNNTDPNKYKTYAKNIDTDTMYIKLATCEVNVNLDKVLYHIKNNIDNSKNVIIDVRDNPGGDSTANDKIFEALKIKTGDFGGVERHSKEVSDFYYTYAKHTKPEKGSRSFERNNDSVKNENINLYVLMNENVFSSAQWLATVVKDGELGTLVGKPSRNTPSSYGNIIPFNLNNTNIQGQISFTKWLRPDETKDSEKVLEPHMKINEGEDALEKTLEIINNKN